MFKRIIRSLIPHHIASQVGLIFGILIIIALAALGFFLINTSRQAVADSVLRDYQDIARRAVQELTTFIDKPKDLLVNTAVLLGTIPLDDNETQRTVIFQLFTNHSIMFEQIAFTDIDGREMTGSEWNKPPKDYADTTIFKMVKSTNRTAFTNAYFSADHVPYFMVAVPVRKLTAVKGYLIAEVKLSSFWEVVKDIHLPNGEAFLVDEAGYILVHREESRIYRSENLASSPPVQAVLQGELGSQEEEGLPGKGTWLYAYAPIRPFGWGLIIRQPARTAYAFSNRMQQTAFIIIILAILTAILFALFLARWIAGPIKHLVATNEQVALGNLEQEVAIARNDEVGGLLRSFNEMVKKLRQARRLEKLSTIGLATSKIGHELRNPLVAIKTFIQLLPRRQQDEKFIAGFNEMVPAEMSRLEKMVKELTDFSAAPKMQLAECALDQILNHSLNLFREELRSHHIAVLTNMDSDHTRLTADSDRLNQVFINLIHNAIGAMPEGGELAVNSRLDDAGKTVIIEIKDTGCGIPPAELANLFEPFQTFKRGGLGLGLTICKEIVEQHRGKIEAASQVDKGTTFTITLPLH